jgi:hypothetical protein
MTRKIFNSKGLITVTAILLSCNDFLTVAPRSSLTEQDFYSKDGLESLLVGAYAMLDGFGVGTDADFVDWEAGPSNWIYGSVAGGDAHTGSDPFVDPAAIDIMAIEQYDWSPAHRYLNKKWIALYAGVARSNEVLRVLKKVKDISKDDSLRVGSEARTLRGVYYLELTKLWHKVPYVDEENDQSLVKNDVEIWDKIEGDLFDGYTTLPEELAEVGRINKWAAAAFYAKALMYEKKYSQAKMVLEDIYDNGKNPLGVRYQLFPTFDQVFDVERENGVESVFAVQYSVNDGTGGANGGVGEVLNL